jgi:hypothetical protein
VAVAGELRHVRLALEPVPPPTAPAPPRAEVAPERAASLSLTAPRPVAPDHRRTPLVRTWWLWTAVGVAIVGTAVTIGVVEGRPSERVYHREVP